MRHHRGVTVALGDRDRLQRLGQRADLVDLDQQRIRQTLADAHFEALRVGHEQVVTHQLHALADLCRERSPAFEIVLAHAVFDRDDRIGVAQRGKVVGHGVGREREALAADLILPVLEELGRRAIEREHHVFARLETGLLDRGHNEIERISSAGKVRGKTAFIAHCRREALLVQALFQGVEHLSAPAHGFGQRRRADRHDHEFLEIDRVVGMLAAVDDVHHRHRQDMRRNTADIAVERHAARIGSGLGNGETGAENGVGAKAALVFSAVQFDHRKIDLALVFGIHADDDFGDVGIDGRNRLGHAFAEIARLIAVAQFNRFMRAGRCARRNGRTAKTAVLKQDIDLNSGVAAAVENFAGMNVNDRSHGLLPAGWPQGFLHATVWRGSYRLEPSQASRVGSSTYLYGLQSAPSLLAFVKKGLARWRRPPIS